MFSGPTYFLFHREQLYFHIQSFCIYFCSELVGFTAVAVSLIHHWMCYPLVDLRPEVFSFSNLYRHEYLFLLFILILIPDPL